jgi:hypothetical protein
MCLLDAVSEVFLLFWRNWSATLPQRCSLTGTSWIPIAPAVLRARGNNRSYTLFLVMNLGEQGIDRGLGQILKSVRFNL